MVQYFIGLGKWRENGLGIIKQMSKHVHTSSCIIPDDYKIYMARGGTSEPTAHLKM